MSKEPKQVAKETLQNIIKDLFETKRDSALTSQEVHNKLNEHIESAYAEVSVQDKTALYKALAILLHPDLFSKKYPKLAEYLEQLKIGDEPFKILNRLNAKHLLNDVTNNPTSGFSSALQYIFHLMSPMEEGLDRYYQPVKFLAKSVYWTLSVLIKIAAIVGAISLVISGVAILIVNSLINYTLNALTNDQYNNEVLSYLEPNFEEHKKNYLSNLKKQVARVLKSQGKDGDAEIIQNLSDDELYERLVEDKLQQISDSSPFSLFNEVDEEELKKIIRQEIKQEILKSISVNNFTRLKLIALSLYKSITKPFDQDNHNIFVSLLLVRPLQVLFSPFILGAAAALELSPYAITALALGGVLANFLVMVGTLAVLNLPLYTLDLCRYAARKIFECACTNEKSDKLTEEFVNKGRPSLLLLEWDHESQSSLSKSDKPPLHHDPLFGSLKEQNKLNDLDEQENLSCGFS